jgi:hypothetical protein
METTLAFVAARRVAAGTCASLACAAAGIVVVSCFHATRCAAQPARIFKCYDDSRLACLSILRSCSFEVLADSCVERTRAESSGTYVLRLRSKVQVFGLAQYAL